MAGRNTLIRSLHDVGLAAWFGGSLMGAVGLNGGASTANDPRERLTISSAGWAKWSPVQIAAIAAHGIGGIGLILNNKGRLVGQAGARQNTAVKLVLTGVAGVATVYSGILGGVIASHADEGADTVTTPNAVASAKLAAAQRKQKILQWVVPATTATLVVLAAQQGEQQRPIAGLLQKLTK